MLEAELKKLTVEQGGIRPGVARREAFRDSPPSADMTYLKPWAESVISFAMTGGTDWFEDYLGKVERMTMRDNMYHIYHNIYLSHGSGFNRLNKHEPIVADYARNAEGYLSDQTRIFSIGSLNEKFYRAHRVMLDVQKTLAREGRPGVRAKDLYDLTAKIVEKAGLLEGFIGYP